MQIIPQMAMSAGPKIPLGVSADCFGDVRIRVCRRPPGTCADCLERNLPAGQGAVGALHVGVAIFWYAGGEAKCEELRIARACRFRRNATSAKG